jgi:hypothetical protein
MRPPKKIATEPTAVGAGRSAGAVPVARRRRLLSRSHFMP